MTQEKLWTKDFIVISVATFFLFLTYYSLLVTLPNAAMIRYGVSEIVAGLYTTFFLFAAIIVRPFIGTWIKWIGKKTILMISCLIFAGASFSYNLFDSFIIILIIRFIHGLGFGLSTTITAALVADIIPQSRKGEGVGYFVMASNLAMVIGPFIGLTVFNHFNLTILFWTATVASILALILSWTTKGDDHLVNDFDEIENEPKEQTIYETRALPIALTAAYLGIAYSAILSFLAVFASQIGLQSVSSYYFTVYALVLIVSRPFTGRWFDQYGPNVIIYPAIIFFSIGMFVLGQSTGASLFLFSAALIGLGWGTLFPSFQTLAIHSTIPKRWPIATATFLSVFDIGIALGSFLAGLLVKKIELGQLYVLLSGYILLSLLFYYLARRKKISVN